MLSDRDNKMIARRLRREGAAFEKERDRQKEKKTRGILAGKMVPLGGEFTRFCRKVGLWNVCSFPLGQYGSDWDHYELSQLDRQIYIDSLDDLSTYIFCSQYPKGSPDLGFVGQPVFDTKQDRVVLEKVGFDSLCDMMRVDLVTIHGEVGERMLLSSFLTREPKLIGVGEYDKLERRYVIHEVEIVPPPEPIPQKKNFFQRMLDKMFI